MEASKSASWKPAAQSVQLMAPRGEYWPERLRSKDNDSVRQTFRRVFAIICTAQPCPASRSCRRWHNNRGMQSYPRNYTARLRGSAPLRAEGVGVVVVVVGALKALDALGGLQKFT